MSEPNDVQELLPCPFCGEAPINKSDRASVYCNNPSCGAHPSTTGFSKAEAIAKWNRRSPTLAVLSARIEGLEKALSDLGFCASIFREEYVESLSNDDGAFVSQENGRALDDALEIARDVLTPPIPAEPR